MARRTRKARTDDTAKPATAPTKQPIQELVTVEGRARRPQTFNLPHEVYCAAMGECACTTRRVAFSQYVDTEGGKRREVAWQDKRISSSFTVLFRRRVTIPKAALLCPEVKSAIARKDLRVRS